MSDRPGGAARLKTLHEALTLTALGAIAGHGLVLLGDGYLSPGLSGIAVPFVMGFKQFWTGLGVIGGWMAAILGLSYYARRWIGAARWRKLHRWTLLAWALAVAHTIGSGTDGSSSWLLLILAAVGLPAVGFALKRAADRPRERPLSGGAMTGRPALEPRAQSAPNSAALHSTPHTWTGDDSAGGRAVAGSNPVAPI